MEFQDPDFTLILKNQNANQRLDEIVAALVVECSRTRAARLIREGRVLIDGIVKKPGYRVKAGESIRISIPPPEPIACRPEAIPLDILYEDRHLIVVNKPPGLVVHPAPGHSSGTLVNALLHHCPDLAGIGGEIRPGIVHRLDKDTSGTLVAAKDEPTHLHLSAQFKARNVKKTYLTLVHGCPPENSGAITFTIGRHPQDRKRMSIRSPKGRNAQTHWFVRKRFAGYAFLEIHLDTGRTHQIRVHCAAIGHPVIGDPVYGPKKQKGLDIKAARQMLHAWRLAFIHPQKDRPMDFESPLPEDMRQILAFLERQEAVVL